MKRVSNIFILIAVGLLLSLLVSVTVCAQDRGVQTIDLGSKAFETIADLENYLAQHSNDFQARRQYADALFDLKRYKEAADQYELFLQHMQGAPDTVHRYLMAISGYPGDNLRGERAAEHYLGFYPTDFELLMRLGYFRLWQGKYKTALESFQQALRLNPDHGSSREGVVEAQAGLVLLARLENPPPTTVSDPSQYPQLDERRFRFIYDLMNYKRFFSAYEQLMLLAERHKHTNRWLALYAEIDRALIQATGSTPAFPADRYSYLLALQPDNREIRYALVDALLENDRLEEAYETLLVPSHVDIQDSGFVSRLNALDDRKEFGIALRIEELEVQLAEAPDNEALLAQIIAYYQIARRPEDALCRYEEWMALRPEDPEVRYAYARLLLDVGRVEEANEHIAGLLIEDVSNIAYIRLYTRSVLIQRDRPEYAIELLEGHLTNYPNDVDVLLDLSEVHLTFDNPEEADVLLRRAFTRGEPSDRGRLLYLDQQIERALRRRKAHDQQRLLHEARTAAQNAEYDHAIEQYEMYFESKGARTRPVLEELARVYSLSGDHTTAISIYDALQERGYAPSVAKEIARNRYLLLDHAGAIHELETLIKQNPRDTEARELLQQMYLEVQRYAQADTTYNSLVEGLAENSRLKSSFNEKLSERINLIERAIDTDYVGLVVPVSQYTRARGSITSFEHWGQGLMTQVTLPAKPRPFMVTAGLISHFMNGTRRLLPGTPSTLTRINQIIGGAYFDLTAPDFANNAGYTNRLWMQFGAFDYSGTRTSGFFDLRYLKKSPGKYTASLGMRSTEGALSLWSPAGGEFGLRLTQFDFDIYSLDIKPDSLIRLRADVALNLSPGLLCHL